MIRFHQILLLLAVLPAAALAADNTGSNARVGLSRSLNAHNAPSASTPAEPEMEQAVTTMEATAATIGEDAPAPGNTRYRFNVPVDIRNVPVNVTMFVACRLLDQTGTRAVRAWAGNRRRSTTRPVYEHIALGIADVPLRSGAYKGSVQVDIDLPQRGAASPDSYICQLEYRSRGEGGLPEGSLACFLGTAEGSKCDDFTQASISTMKPN